MPRYKNRKVKKHNRKHYRVNMSNVLAKAGTALSIAQQLQKLVNVERKYVITSNSNVELTDSPTVTLLTGTAQGTTESTRIGNRIKSHDMFFRMFVSYNTLATAQDQVCRIMIVNDRSSQGEAIQSTDVLQEADILSPLNVEQCPSRLNILFDQYFYLNAGTRSIKSKELYRKIDWHTTYSGTSANQTDAESGHIYLLMFSNQSSNGPLIKYSFKYGYVDN